MGSYLNLMPHELEPGDDLGEDYGLFLQLRPLEWGGTSHYNCILVFQDGHERMWHTEAPIRVYRSNDG